MTSTKTAAVDKVLSGLTFETIWADAVWCQEQLENHNKSNRPMTMSIVKRWRDRMLEGRWVPSPDCIAYDLEGNLLTGQHRLYAVVLAEQMRQLDPDYVKNVYGIDKPISIPFVIGRGFMGKHADVIDIGKNRTSSDVLARRHLFGVDVSDAESKKLHKELAVAARLLWTRINGKTVKGSGVFLHHELKAFVDDNTGLVEAVKTIRELDNGDAHDRLICNFLSIGYASGLLQLMISANEDKAMEFWTLFAAGALENSHPIARFKSYLLDSRTEGTVDRDHVVNAAIKAWNFFIAGTESVTKPAIKPKKDERPWIKDSVDADTSKVSPEPSAPAKATTSVVATPAEEKVKKKPAKASPKPKVDTTLNAPLPGEVDHMKPKFGTVN
jgi:hypothetical protein